MANDSWNLMVLWITQIGEFELIGRYSKFVTGYCSLEDSYFGKTEIFPMMYGETLSYTCIYV